MPSPSRFWYRLGGLLPLLAAAPLVATPPGSEPGAGTILRGQGDRPFGR